MAPIIETEHGPEPKDLTTLNGIDQQRLNQICTHVNRTLWFVERDRVKRCLRPVLNRDLPQDDGLLFFGWAVDGPLKQESQRAAYLLIGYRDKAEAASRAYFAHAHPENTGTAALQSVYFHQREGCKHVKWDFALTSGENYHMKYPLKHLSHVGNGEFSVTDQGCNGEGSLHLLPEAIPITDPEALTKAVESFLTRQYQESQNTPLDSNPLEQLKKYLAKSCQSTNAL